MEHLFGPTLIGKHGPVPVASLANTKYVLIYFSAHWCPPCRAFTPKLALFYESVNSAHKQVEIIFSSADRSPDQFQEYFESMPWLAIPFADAAHRNGVAQRFGISGIPALLLIDREGNVKRSQCREDVMAKGPLALADWDSALR
ncbi:unnamed protein product [Blepharisma stoltei]|uniref:Thioredoxin domain-containing protein n=1 Tax=Blepharisma stoltei TaxID=1481888 RepID=A0AAU9KHU0_9CILI|nr:unnamed protein product [Blepharisma stoltei]